MGGQGIRRRIVARLAVCAVVFVLAVCGEAFAVQAPARKIDGRAPSVEAVRVYQIGSNQLLLEFRGTDMPLPAAVNRDGAAAAFFWRGARFPRNADRKDWWNDFGWDVLKIERTQGERWTRRYDDIPLVDEIRVSPVSDGVLLEVIGPRPLAVKSLAGMAGSSRHRLILETPLDMPKPPSPKGPAPPPGDPLSVSSPVTLELRGAPLRDVFRMLAKLRGLDLVLDASVPDHPTTFSFSKAPFSEVFSWLMRMNGLTYSVSGKTLVVGSPSAVAKMLGTVTTRRYSVSYADIKKLPALITSIMSLEVKAVADERTRCLYITSSPEGHRCVEALLNRLDSPGKQIMIEARLVEINDGARQEFESTLAAVYNGWIFSYGSAGLGGRYTYGNGSVTPNVDPTGTTRPGELPSIGGTDNDAGFPSYLADSAMKMVDAALRAMESDNKGKVLASPSVAALDGRKASVRLTHNYLYQSGVDENGNPEFTNQETGPMLEFTPTLGRDGYITINMKISTGEIVAFRRSGDSEAPETTKREVDTSVRVRDGELFVIGGLYQENKTNNVSRVPVLGYVPILGELFKTRTTQHTKSQMAFIAVPYIIDIPSGPVEAVDLPDAALRR
ncbi:secretin N-terminal domain-containing protein [Cloacibacillus sp. An23]|uniref:type II secretion system protein GspD n=1 Tax=Cloacibacillus sp. An23 TaxID=1965591 RepID=UPI000B3929E5|nr:secretin N-terminal domain-containing protein [Cloacibacillus sp. An23]OUO92686.1 hypothetical protein B5F39_11090 [Cloacibacillus sp. An23]